MTSAGPPLTGVLYRKARPQDAAVVVPLMHAASPELLSPVLAERGPALLRHDFLRGRGIFGHRNQFVAVAGGVVVATVTAYPGTRYRSLALHTLLTLARHLSPPDLLATARRAQAVRHMFIPPSPEAVFVANLCVGGAYRSRGVGRDLLEHAVRSVHAAMTASGQSPPRCAELDVSASNIGAQRLYERMGFTVTGERSDTTGSGLDGFRRMRRPIGHPR